MALRTPSVRVTTDAETAPAGKEPAANRTAALALEAARPLRSAPGTDRDTISHSVEPWTEGVAHANGRRPPSENEEGRLERVLGVVVVGQDAPTHPEHQRPMALHQRREGTLVIA